MGYVLCVFLAAGVWGSRRFIAIFRFSLRRLRNYGDRASRVPAGKWQAAILEAEAARPKLRVVTGD
jgi:hypothetical protein